MADVHIYAPPSVRTVVMHKTCPTCEATRPMLGQFYEWHGWYLTCIGCGEQWGDSEMLPRPFKPRWRVENIRSALRKLVDVQEVIRG